MKETIDELVRRVPKDEIKNLGGSIYVTYAGFELICGNVGKDLVYSTAYVQNKIRMHPERWPKSILVKKRRFFCVQSIGNWIDAQLNGSHFSEVGCHGTR